MGGAFQQARLFGGDVAEGAGVLKAGHHAGQGLGGAPLALAQGLHGSLVGGVCAQVPAAQSLHGDDLASQQAPCRLLDEGVALRPCGCGLRQGAASAQHGPAVEAGVWLGVVAAVLLAGVLGRAAGAHGKGGHGRERAVVGEVVDDGEARAAVGAVDEGVAVAPVLWVEQLCQAVRAGG